MTQFDSAGAGVALGQLRRYGLHLAGEPPTVQLTIAGAHPVVRMTSVDNGVVLRAELVMSGPQDVGRLADAALATPGDTSFAFEANRLVATRTLAGPTLGVIYDALFDLAKATCSLSRYLTQLAEFAAAPHSSQLVAEPTLAPPVARPPAPTQPGFRFYVETPTWMQASSGERVKELVPGAWYRGVDEEQGWVRAVTDEGVEGWVPVVAIRRT